MSFTCPSCTAPLEPANVDLATRTGWCSPCERVVEVDEGGAERPLPALPPRFEVEDTGGRLRVRYPWRSARYYFMAFFCLLWDGFLVFWYAIALSMVLSGEPDALMLLVGPLLHVAVGVGLTWYTVAGFVNWTEVVVADGTLSIRWGPIWWPGQRTQGVAGLEQLTSRRHVQRSKNGTRISYAVHAKWTHGREEKLLAGLSTGEQALWLERRIEQHLGIRDRQVGGELAR